MNITMDDIVNMYDEEYAHRIDDEALKKMGEDVAFIREYFNKNQDSLGRLKSISPIHGIYSTVRPYLHNIAVIDKSFSHEPIASTGFAAMVCNDFLYNRYLYYVLLSPSFDSYANDNANSKGVAYPAINDKNIYRAPVPIPPLEEQQRIVKRLDALLPLCDDLENLQ